MIHKGEAIQALCPTAEWAMDGDDLEWLSEDIDQPSEEAIIRKQAEMQYEREIKVYQQQRKMAYPSRDEQLDMMYWDKINGTTTWDAAINAVKEAYPKVDVDETIKQQKADEAWNNILLQRYTKAVERLSKYRLSVGKEATDDITEVIQLDPIVDPSITQTLVTSRGEPAIEPLPATFTRVHLETREEIEIDNPIVVKDEAERAEAQAVVDSTPQAVIDIYEA
jgi:hypothetical protein